MSITFTPQGGDVLLCDFGPDPRDPATYPLVAGHVAAFPEMIKQRHAVVISANRDLIIVAPFSSVEPPRLLTFHCRISADVYPFFAPGVNSWLKGDALMAVSPSRLDRLFYDGRFQRASLSAADFRRIRHCVLHAMGLGTLTQHV